MAKELNKIIELLEMIKSDVDKLSFRSIKSNDFSALINEIEALVRRDKIVNKIKEKDKHRISEVVKGIINEAERNKNENHWLISQRGNKTKLYFSSGRPISEIKFLELIPLPESPKIEKRSLLINELHKDDILPVYHYNLVANGINIHVIPKGYRHKIEKFIYRPRVA